MREDKALANRFLRSTARLNPSAKEIEQRITIRERISTSVEVPSARVEAHSELRHERRSASGTRTSGTEHLLLAFAARRKMFWRGNFAGRGLAPSTLREELARQRW